MPIQAPQWTEFLSCPICFNIFDEREHRPISLGCGHTVCKTCLSKLTPRKCPFDQNSIIRDIEELPVNYALLQLVGVAVPESEQSVPTQGLAENVEYYNSATRCIEELAMYLKPTNKESQNSGSSQSTLSRPMQRKLVTLLNCQLIEEEGRTRAVRAARSLGERTVTELILQHQNPQQLSANLWAGVRARGCQFLGPAMQEEVLKLILLALEDGSPLSRKVLVLFVVQRLESQYPQASKTAIGHVVQLLYRASCFKVTKREEESSLMQLKEEFCTYDALRREHDSQIVQIATEAGLRISPEQWSSLLYGDTAHKSHMQSIIDKLQTPQSFSQSINELTMALQRTGDPGNLSRLKVHLELLSNVDPGSDSPTPTWEILDKTMQAIKAIVEGLVDFCQNRTSKKQEFVPLHNPKYKTSMCRDLVQKGKCPRGTSCTFAHSAEELERYRQMSKKGTSVTSLTQPPMTAQIKVSTSSALTPQERESLKRVIKSSNAKINSSKAREPQMVTAELPSETKNTAASYQRKTEHSGKAVSVPIVKPCTLPTNTKAKMESSIYSLSLLSDKIEDDSLHPGIIPVAKKISSVQAHGGQGLQPSQMPGRPPPAQHAHAQQQQQYIYNPNQYHSSVTYQSPVYSPAAGQPRHVQTTRWQSVPSRKRKRKATSLLGSPRFQGVSPLVCVHFSWTLAEMPVASRVSIQFHMMATPEFQAISGDGRAEGNALQKVATVMPSYVRSDTDLYSVDCYGLNARDRAHYSSQAMRGRGKSPSEQLEELHTRKSELLAQLNKTRTMINQKEDLQDSDSRNDTAESADSTVSSSWEEESFSSLQSVLRMNEVSGAMLHHQHLSEQLSAGITTTTATTSSQYSLEGHRGQNHTSASTYCTMSLTQENLHSWGMEDTPKPDAEWSDGDEIIDLVMSSASMKDELVCSDEEAMTPWDPNWEDQIPLSTAVSDEMDEFVPFSEDYIVSKYGPISRMVKTKLRQQGPVCVTAGEMVFNHSGTVKSPFFCKSQDTQPVNAVTPMQRPYPITSQVPSRFLPQNPNVQRPTPSPSLQTAEPKKEQTGNGTKKTVSEETKTANKASQKELLRNPQAQKGGHHVHKADPNGMQVAASLPTALLQPNVLARANKDSEPHTLWMLRQRMSCQEQNRVPQVSSQPYVPENLKSEIANLNSKIENLQLSEDERLVKELQAIELSIAQAERNTEPVHPVPVYGDVQTGALSPHTLYTAFNHRQPLHVQGQYPEQPVAANMYVKSMEQQEPVPSGQLDRMRQYDSYIGSQGVDYLLAREAQKLEINRQHAKVIQESSDRLYAEDIAKREMEKFVRSKNE